MLTRLIRRFRVAETPARFQQWACHALRVGLGAEAVAWVPDRFDDPVYASGRLAALEGHSALERPDSDADADDRPRPGSWSVTERVAGVSGTLVAVIPGATDDRGDAEALMAPVAALIAAHRANSEVYADLKGLLFGVVRALTAAVDAKDPYTCGHSERVARIAARLGGQLGMTGSRRSDLYLMGLLHDVGKIGVDDAVLRKAGPLTPDEYRQIQRHVEIGVEILSGLTKLAHLLPGIRHHHESLDGRGYPDGLSGEAIPLEARVLAVADSFDAMASSRPYRPGMSASRIDEIFRLGQGVQWDPRVVDALFACRAEVESVRQTGLGESLNAAVSVALGRG